MYTIQIQAIFCTEMYTKNKKQITMIVSMVLNCSPQLQFWPQYNSFSGCLRNGTTITTAAAFDQILPQHNHYTHNLDHASKEIGMLYIFL